MHCRNSLHARHACRCSRTIPSPRQPWLRPACAPGKLLIFLSFMHNRVPTWVHSAPRQPCCRVARALRTIARTLQGVLAEVDPDSGNLVHGSPRSRRIGRHFDPALPRPNGKRAQHPVSRERAACLVRPRRGLAGAFARSKRRDGVRPATARGSAAAGGDRLVMRARRGKGSGSGRGDRGG